MSIAANELVALCVESRYAPQPSHVVLEAARTIESLESQLAAKSAELRAMTERAEQLSAFNTAFGAKLTELGYTERFHEEYTALKMQKREAEQRAERAEAAIRNSAETYQHVEDDRTWNGQEFCWFCGGEMANQTVNHRETCIWTALQEGK